MNEQRDDRKEQSHTEAVREARALLDPDDPPRSYFVGVAYENGSDFASGVNKASVESGQAQVDLIETLATHANVVARSLGEDRSTVLGYALQVAREQEEI